MAINHNTTGKLKYIFYVVILLFFISTSYAESHTGEVDLQLSESAPDWSLLGADTYPGDIEIYHFQYKGVADAGIPDTLVFHDALMGKQAAYNWEDIPQNVGGSFALYNGGVFSGSGGITIHRVNNVDVGRVDIWYQFDDTDFVPSDTEVSFDVTLYASPISEYYGNFNRDHGGTPYSTQNVYVMFLVGAGPDHGTHASWSTGAGSYVEYEYRGHFINEYNITLSGATASSVITRDGLGQQLSSSKFKLKNSTGSVVYQPSSYSVINSTHNHDNGSYYYYLDVENYGDVLIYDAISAPPPPQPEDTIEWGADSYVVDDTGSYSWSLSDDNWDTWLYSKKVSIYRSETLVHEASLANQTGTGYYTFEDEGSYTVKLRHTSFLLPHVTIDTDNVIVSPIGESFISVTNTTVYINTPIGFQFSYGFTPLPVSPGVWSSATSIEARKLIDGSWVPVNRWFYPDLGNVTPNTLYTYTIGITGAYSDSTLVSEGEYIFYLTDLNHGDVASTQFYTVEYQPGDPTDNISTTYLNVVGDSFLINDPFEFSYGIDNTNFTTGTNYMEVYNYDYGITTQSALLYKQSWYRFGALFPPSDSDPTDSFHLGIIVALPGNNTMLIRHDDINGSTELVHDNFTLSDMNAGGYRLKLSAYEACINDPITIWVTIPTASNLTIYSPTGAEIITYNLNASTTLTYYFPMSGQYNLELISSGSNYAEMVASIHISDCADDSIITPPSGEMDDMYLNLFNAMTLPAFWGMIIFIGFIGGLAMKKDKNGDALVAGNGIIFIAFGLLNLLSIVGLFAPYTFYVIVSTWIFAGMFFGVGKYLARGE